MLIYVAVLTKFVIRVVRISLAASSVSFSFLSPRHHFFSPVNICRYRQFCSYVLYYLTCFRSIVTFSIRGNFFLHAVTYMTFILLEPLLCSLTALRCVLFLFTVISHHKSSSSSLPHSSGPQSRKGGSEDGGTLGQARPILDLRT